jgi:flagellar hook-associated protein 2
MAGLTNISGLASGVDWSSMINQIMTLEHRRVDLVTEKKTETESKLKEWQSFNAKLTALQSAAGTLKDPEGFKVFVSAMSTDSSTVKGSDLLSVTTGNTASSGSYALRVTNLAQAQKLSSNPFTSTTAAIGSDYAGDFLINGRVVNIKATDTLADVAQRINTANTGTNPSSVTASIVKYGSSDYRMILTSDKTGAKGVSLVNGGTAGLVQKFGWKDDQAASVKNAITKGSQSDRFTSSTVAVQTLLGLATGETDSVTIGDKSVSINLSAMSLADIKDAINTAAPTGVNASIITQTDGGKTTYRLQIDGTQTFTDAKNILNTLGVLDRGSVDVSGKISGKSMTTEGAFITASTLLTGIDGYNTFTAGGSPGGDFITLSGKTTSGADVNTAFTITSASTVQDLLDAVKSSYGNVAAYVTNDGKIRIDDLSGGTGLVVNLTDHIHDPNSELEFVTADGDFAAAVARKRQIIAGEDASVEIDGVTVTSAENSIKDAITGVTLNLTKEDSGTTVALSIKHDTDTIKKNVQSFVSAYNEVISYINTQFSYDTDKKTTGGILFGDGTLSSIKSDFASAITQTITGVNSEFSILGLVGITMDNTMKLSVDDAKLTGYLQTNFSDVLNLFAGQGATSTSSLAYVSHNYNTKAGEYTVHITDAATRSASTSDNAVSGSLGASETLTITEGDKSAAIALTSGMSIADIVTAVNDEMDNVYSETLVGSESLYSDSGLTTAISAATKWNSIYGTGGSANLANGDVISFDATTRTGEAVSGSYTIRDTAADSVQGLLTAIQQAFGNTVNAVINSSGRVVVTDKASGNSALSLTLDTSQAHNLSPGTVTTSNAGGREGRYAISVTASADATGHLVLTHNTYGNGGSFTTAETGNLLWTGPGTRTVNNGKDVAGTINGEAATGSGQTLTGNSGQANIAGLVIQYTGTSQNADIGTVNLTFGTAELFDRLLYNITDATSGYLSFKQESLQNSIKGYETRITDMETMLDQEKERMTAKFIAMETAMSKIQQQSNWLAGQLSAAQSGWK